MDYIELLKQAYAESSEEDRRLAEEFMAISTEADEVALTMEDAWITTTST